MLLSEYACRMALKNRIIVQALRGNVAFDAARYGEYAKRSLERLAHEATESAQRMVEIRDAAEPLAGRPTDQHDYRRVDVDNLFRRERVSRSIARRLRLEAANAEVVDALVQAARDDAWHEIATAIEGRLTPPTPRSGWATGNERLDALDLLVGHDLAELAARHRPPETDA